jgi:hypothetical protein
MYQISAVTERSDTGLGLTIFCNNAPFGTCVAIQPSAYGAWGTHYNTSFLSQQKKTETRTASLARPSKLSLRSEEQHKKAQLIDLHFGEEQHKRNSSPICIWTTLSRYAPDYMVSPPRQHENTQGGGRAQQEPIAVQGQVFSHVHPAIMNPRSMRTLATSSR